MKSHVEVHLFGMNELFLANIHSLRVDWRNMCELPDFFSRIVSFMLFTVLLSFMYFILKNS